MTARTRINYHDGSGWNYAVRHPEETPSEAVARSIERRIRGQHLFNGTLHYSHETPSAHVYRGTLVWSDRGATVRSGLRVAAELTVDIERA